MTVALGLAAFNALITAVGYAALAALGALRLRRAPWLMGIAYLTGWALLGVVLALALLAGLDPAVRHVIIAAAAIVVVAVAAARGAPRFDFLHRRARNLPAALAASAGAICLVVAAVVALIVAIRGEWPSEWDSWGFWVPRAETIYYAHGLDTGVGGWPAISHPEYPPLLAVMYAAAWHFSGGFHPSLLPVQQTLLGIAFIAAVAVIADRVAPRWLSFPTLAALAAAPGFWWRTQTLMADPTLAYEVAAAAVTAFVWLQLRERAYLALAALFLAAAVLTKTEGLSLGALLAVVVAITAFATGRRTGLASLVLLATLLVIVPWRVWLGRHGLPTSSTDYHATTILHPELLAHRFHRLAYALHWLWHSVFRTSQWLVVLPLALAAVVVAAARARLIAGAALGWIVLGFLGLATIYWIGIPELHYYVDTSADRVASTIVVVAGALTPVLVAAGLRTRT